MTEPADEPGYRLPDIEIVDEKPPAGFHAAVEEALADLDAGRSVVYMSDAEFLQALRRGVACPVLHLHGGGDQFLLPDTAQGSGRYVSGPYTWQLVPEAGHFLPEEAPDLVTALLLHWLDTPDTPDARPVAG